MPEYDELAVREAIVNGLIHRKYTTQGAEVSVDIYDDRIEVTSPGGMISGKLLKGEVDEKIPSLRRNPILADVFARMHFMDERGSGFDKIKDRTNRLFEDHNNHVRFYATDTFFTVIIDNANYSNDKVNDKINDEVNDEINDKANLTENAKKVLELINENTLVTRTELAKLIKKSESTIDRAIKELKKNKLLKEKHAKKGGFWNIL